MTPMTINDLKKHLEELIQEGMGSLPIYYPDSMQDHQPIETVLFLDPDQLRFGAYGNSSADKSTVAAVVR